MFSSSGLQYFTRLEFRISCDLHTATFVLAIGMSVVADVKCNDIYTLYLFPFLNPLLIVWCQYRGNVLFISYIKI